MAKEFAVPVFNERTGIEYALLKNFKPVDTKSFRAMLEVDASGLPVKRFGGKVFDSSPITALQNAPRSKALVVPPPSDEVGQRLITGPLYSACLECAFRRNSIRHSGQSDQSDAGA